MKKLAIALLLATAPAQAHPAEVKVAAVSFHFRDIAYNIPRMVDLASDAARNGARLIVFPEMAATGFYGSLEAAMPNVDTIPGKATDALGKVAQRHDAFIAFGLTEKDPATGVLYNSAALVGPNGFVGKYRKNQLAVGEDNIYMSPGNLGFPVFETAIGKIALLICYDDSQLQSLLLPSLRGADILAYSVAAAYKPRAEEGSHTNHTTIGSMATLPGWIGMNVVGADASGVDPISKDDVVVTPGGSAVWDAQGNVLASGTVTKWTDPKEARTIYATIDPARPNPQRQFWLKHRRPELYQDYNYFRPVHDANADRRPAQVSALLVQYEPRAGDVERNFEAIERLVDEQSQTYDLVVLPFNSLIGNVTVTRENVGRLAEPLHGASYERASGLARKYKTYLLFSMPEVVGGRYHETAVLFDPTGKQVGLYRKSHLNDQEATWATAGDQLPVFETRFGRVAVMLNDETRIPEVTEIYELKRANLILVPVAYNQREYGGDVRIPRGLVPEESNRGMYIWYSMAKQSQAFVLVANYVKGEHGDVGQSALYSLVPEEGYYPPKIAPRDRESALPVFFVVNPDTPLWTNQQDKVVERRWDRALPLTLDEQSECLEEWRKNSTSPEVCARQH